MPSDVPCADFCEKAKKYTNAGTMIMPPPTPTIPLNIPAAKPISSSRTIVVMVIFVTVYFLRKVSL